MLKKSELSPPSDLLRVATDCLFAIKSWRIWLYMGTQDVRNQFRRSRMGAGWILINLLLMASCVSYIYGRLFHQDIKIFFPTLILGLTIWNFIATIIIQGCLAFQLSEGYVKQFCLPKQLYLFRFFVSTSINFLMGFFVYLLIAIFVHNLPTSGFGWIFLGFLSLFVINIAHLIIAAYWGTRFRDLSPALSGIFQILFYITPIIFTAQMLIDRGIGIIYEYNPFYYLIEVLRHPIMYGTPASTVTYKAILIYGLVVWTIALYTMFKYDRRVAYWL